MVFAASSVLVKCRLCASWELGGGGEQAGWAGVCFLDARLLGVCWWVECSGEVLGGRGGSGSGRILLNKRFHAGWGQLNVPRWACARMPPSWLWLVAPLRLALVTACWAQCCLSACHLCTPRTPTTPPHLRLVLTSSQDQSFLTTCVHVYQDHAVSMHSFCCLTSSSCLCVFIRPSTITFQEGKTQSNLYRNEFRVIVVSV